MKFTSLDLAPEILDALSLCGYTTMTPVQEQTFLPARRGKDILANAQTGTGKTAAFALPILQQMLEKPKTRMSGSPRVLILAPTRELAEQLSESFNNYAQCLDFSVCAIFGGVKVSGQEKKLKAGVDILIATPGRLLEHLLQCSVNLSGVDFIVLDEADRMLDMGFVNDVQAILKQAPKKRQTQLFSATLSPAVQELAKKILHHHQEIRVTRQNATAETVEHVMYKVEERRKLALFMALLDEHNWYQVLVFTSTKEQADVLLNHLKEIKIAAAVCHGDRSQGSRRRALSEFKDGKLQVLISTEVAARGLDIQGLDTVINFNLPYLAEDYVHRIGRTGRAGNKGLAISFISPEEERSLTAIEKLIGASIKRLKKAGFEGRSNDRHILDEQEQESTRPKISQTKRIRDKVTKIKNAAGKSTLSTKTQKVKSSGAKVNNNTTPTKPKKKPTASKNATSKPSKIRQ